MCLARATNENSMCLARATNENKMGAFIKGNKKTTGRRLLMQSIGHVCLSRNKAEVVIRLR